MELRSVLMLIQTTDDRCDLEGLINGLCERNNAVTVIGPQEVISGILPKPRTCRLLATEKYSTLKSSDVPGFDLLVVTEQCNTTWAMTLIDGCSAQVPVFLFDSSSVGGSEWHQFHGHLRFVYAHDSETGWDDMTHEPFIMFGEPGLGQWWGMVYEQLNPD